VAAAILTLSLLVHGLLQFSGGAAAGLRPSFMIFAALRGSMMLLAVTGVIREGAVTPPPARSVILCAAAVLTVADYAAAGVRPSFVIFAALGGAMVLVVMTGVIREAAVTPPPAWCLVLCAAAVLAGIFGLHGLCISLYLPVIAGVTAVGVVFVGICCAAVLRLTWRAAFLCVRSLRLVAVLFSGVIFCVAVPVARGAACSGC
jgi:hypothetical protein